LVSLRKVIFSINIYWCCRVSTTVERHSLHKRPRYNTRNGQYPTKSRSLPTTQHTVRYSNCQGTPYLLCRG